MTIRFMRVMPCTANPKLIRAAEHLHSRRQVSIVATTSGLARSATDAARWIGAADQSDLGLARRW